MAGSTQPSLTNTLNGTSQTFPERSPPTLVSSSMASIGHPTHQGCSPFQTPSHFSPQFTRHGWSKAKVNFHCVTTIILSRHFYTVYHIQFGLIKKQGWKKLQEKLVRAYLHRMNNLGSRRVLFGFKIVPFLKMISFCALFDYTQLTVKDFLVIWTKQSYKTWMKVEMTGLDLIRFREAERMSLARFQNVCWGADTTMTEISM